MLDVDIGETRFASRPIGSGEALRQHLAFLKPFIDAPGTTDVAINQGGELWIENDRGWHQHKLPDMDLARLRTLAKLVATYNGQRLDETLPSLSGALPDGERIQIIRPPALDSDRLSFTIRKPSTVVKTREEYEREDLTAGVREAGMTLSDDDRQLIELRQAKRYWDFIELAVIAKKNIVISGATGTGKTTLGKTLASFIPSHERLITIEDVREIELPNHPNQVNLLYSAGGAGTAPVDAKQLLQACLRMKPSRILLAEIRSKVAYDYIVNVSSGHPGSITTVHAGSCREAFEMLALRMLESPEGRELSRREIMSLLRSKIDLIIQMAVVEVAQPDGSIRKHRRITEIHHEQPSDQAGI